MKLGYNFTPFVRGHWDIGGWDLTETYAVYTFLNVIRQTDREKHSVFFEPFICVDL
jgi:hypothetical protein